MFPMPTPMLFNLSDGSNGVWDMVTDAFTGPIGFICLIGVILICFATLRFILVPLWDALHHRPGRHDARHDAQGLIVMITIGVLCTASPILLKSVDWFIDQLATFTLP